MRIGKWLVAALLVPGIAAVAQVGPDHYTTKAAFERMEKNVAQINIPGEKERWQANVAAWKIVLNSPEQLSKDETDSVNAKLHEMTASLSQVKAPGERERWTANVHLWTAYLGAGGKPADAKKLLADLKTNLEKVMSASEKERWQANYDLWALLVPPAK